MGYETLRIVKDGRISDKSDLETTKNIEYF